MFYLDELSTRGEDGERVTGAKVSILWFVTGEARR